MECTVTGKPVEPEGLTRGEEWSELHTDGVASSRHCEGGVMLTSLEGFKMYCALKYKFKTSNNAAEYEVVIARLLLADSLKVKQLRIQTGFKLVLRKLNSSFVAKVEAMFFYKDVTEGWLSRLAAFEIQLVPRAKIRRRTSSPSWHLEKNPNTFLSCVE